MLYIQPIQGLHHRESDRSNMQFPSGNNAFGAEREIKRRAGCGAHVGRSSRENNGHEGGVQKWNCCLEIRASVCSGDIRFPWMHEVNVQLVSGLICLIFLWSLSPFYAPSSFRGVSAGWVLAVTGGDGGAVSGKRGCNDELPCEW